jgi:hypothetical protein
MLTFVSILMINIHLGLNYAYLVLNQLITAHLGLNPLDNILITLDLNPRI